MNLELIKVVSQIAGLGGIAIGVLLIIFRELIKRNFFPKLKQDQSYSLLRLVVIATWSVAVLGMLGWFLLEFKKVDNSKSFGPNASPTPLASPLQNPEKPSPVPSQAQHGHSERAPSVVMSKPKLGDPEQTRKITQTMINSPGGIQNTGSNVTINQEPKPWALNNNQLDLFVESLKKRLQGTVEIRCINGDSDSCAVARQIRSALEASGWKVSGVIPTMYFYNERNPLPFRGLHLSVPSVNPPEHAESLLQALKTMPGITVTKHSAKNLQGDAIELLIGARPLN